MALAVRKTAGVCGSQTIAAICRSQTTADISFLCFLSGVGRAERRRAFAAPASQSVTAASETAAGNAGASLQESIERVSCPGVTGT
jgi:uncharacterized protein (DUF2336 family)